MSLLPEKLPVEYEIIPLVNPDMRLMAMDKTTSALYFTSGGNIQKSTDWGKTFTTLKTFTGNVARIEVLPNGHLLVMIWNSTDKVCTMQKSKDDGTTWYQVYSGIMKCEPWGGLDVYDKLVIFSEYGRPRDMGSAIYISKDYGETFEQMIEMKGINHQHDVRYDPYEHLIWVVTGDDAPRDKILVTDDFGKTWEQLPEKEFRRCTNIMPLPNHVIFGTDEYYQVGAYRHKRPNYGTFQNEINPEYFWFSRKNTKQDGPDIWATKPVITYGEKGKAYWGYLQLGRNSIMPAAVYVTDGEKVRTLWAQEKISDGLNNHSQFSGIVAMWGPDKDGYIVADLRSKYKDSAGVIRETNILKIKTV